MTSRILEIQSLIQFSKDRSSLRSQNIENNNKKEFLPFSMSVRICGFQSINTAQDEQRDDKQSDKSKSYPLMLTAIIQLIF